MELRIISSDECHAGARGVAPAREKPARRPVTAVQDGTKYKYVDFLANTDLACDFRYKLRPLPVFTPSPALSLVQTAPSQTAGEATGRRGRSHTEPNHKRSGSNLNRAQARRITPAGDPAGASPAPAFPLKASGH